LFDGRKESSSRIMRDAGGVVGAVKWQTPLCAGVGVRAAELLLGDLLVGDRLDDVGAGDEHVARSSTIR
jgi:hypothetical protein